MFTVAFVEITLDRSNIYRRNEIFSEDQEDMNAEMHIGRPLKMVEFFSNFTNGDSTIAQKLFNRTWC